MAGHADEQMKHLVELLSYERTTLPNGLIVLTKRMKTHGLAYLVLGTRRGGSFFGPPELFHLLEHLLAVPYRGTASVDDVGAETSVTQVKAVVATVTERKFKKKFAKLVSQLREPRFDALERERRAVLVELGEHFDDPEVYLENLFLQTLYPKANVVQSFAEEFASVRDGLTKSLLLRYWRRYFVTANLILVVVSETLSHEEVCAQAADLFASKSAPRTRFRRPAVGVPEASFDAPFVTVRPGLRNAYFALGKAMQRFSSNESVILSVIGGLLEDRLNHALRYRRGLVYGVGFSFSASYLVNHWVLRGTCEAKRFDQVIALLRREIERFRVRPRDLERKKEALLEEYVDLISSPERSADFLYDLEVNGMNALKSLAALKRLDVKRAEALRKRYFAPEGTPLVILRSKP